MVTELYDKLPFAHLNLKSYYLFIKLCYKLLLGHWNFKKLLILFPLVLPIRKFIEHQVTVSNLDEQRLIYQKLMSKQSSIAKFSEQRVTF